MADDMEHHDEDLDYADDEIEKALLALLERRVDHVLAVEQPDAHARNRLLERNL